MLKFVQACYCEDHVRRKGIKYTRGQPIPCPKCGYQTKETKDLSMSSKSILFQFRSHKIKVFDIFLELNADQMFQTIFSFVSARNYAYARQRNDVNDYYDDDDDYGSSGYSYGSSGFAYGSSGYAYGTTRYGDNGDEDEDDSDDDDEEEEDEEEEDDDDDDDKEDKPDTSEAADELSELKVQES